MRFNLMQNIIFNSELQTYTSKVDIIVVIFMSLHVSVWIN